jgi:hypothetical protein
VKYTCVSVSAAAPSAAITFAMRSPVTTSRIRVPARN